MDLNYKYEVVDTLGRRWARTLTRLYAVKVAKMVKRDKGIDCQIQQLNGGNTNGLKAS